MYQNTFIKNTPKQFHKVCSLPITQAGMNYWLVKINDKNAILKILCLCLLLIILIQFLIFYTR